MSQLIALIDEYKDAHGQPSDSSIARAIGVAPQTISSWRKRGIRQLPDAQTLRSLAKFIALDYEGVVLPAAMVDIGYLIHVEPMPVPPNDDDHLERGSSA